MLSVKAGDYLWMVEFRFGLWGSLSRDDSQNGGHTHGF